jgi:hypothetical protein
MKTYQGVQFTIEAFTSIKQQHTQTQAWMVRAATILRILKN